MSKRSPIEQLDEAVEAILARPGSALPEAGPATLVRLAAQLRGLPRESFRVQLKTELMERSITMASQASQASLFREGFHTVTPYLVEPNLDALVDFIKRVFGGLETFRSLTPGPGGGFHCEMRVGDSMLMMGGGGSMRHPAMPAALLVYVDDVDDAYRRALEAGATSLHVPSNQGYGERDASVRDPFGNEWYVTQPLAGNPRVEGRRTVTMYFHPAGAARMIDFLKQAFGAEEKARYEAPDGSIAHAQVQIGDSPIELGEAHGVYQPMQSMIYLYVDDVDAWYKRAVEGGGISISAPADAPYGDRLGAVRDAFGNQWYMSTPIKAASG